MKSGLDINYCSDLWCITISKEELAKNNVLNINKIFNKWTDENPDHKIQIPSIYNKGKDHEKKNNENLQPPEEKKDLAVNDKSKERKVNTLNPKGTEFLQSKIAELEDRLIYSGMVNTINELDLSDSFIDNSLSDGENINVSLH